MAASAATAATAVSASLRLAPSSPCGVSSTPRKLPSYQAPPRHPPASFELPSLMHERISFSPGTFTIVKVWF